MDKKFEMGCRKIDENTIKCDVIEDNERIGSVLFTSKNNEFKIEIEGNELIKRVKK